MVFTKRIKAFLWRPSHSRVKIRYVPDDLPITIHNESPLPIVSQRLAGPGCFFSNATSLIIDNSTMTHIQGDINIVTQTMTSLSLHTICSTAYDDPARDPPPRCHSETRVKLITRIISWLDCPELRQPILWLTGECGVGKTAVAQTIAERLAKSDSLGATVFISKPDGHNDPNRVFITIAYYLATRIDAYRNFIVDRLTHDPDLLNTGMAAQFATFIVEPFRKEIAGAGEKRWTILLDGLDECEGDDAQCDIIRLISTFVRTYPSSPLVWIISSRPEPHISNTFNEDEVRRSCREERLLSGCTEACEDVNHFLRSEFREIRKDCGHFPSSDDWPKEEALNRLSAAASGLFVFASTAVRFIADPTHADPVTRLQLLLSTLDNSSGDDSPFAHLDALYTQILSSIPSRLLPTTKQLLGFAVSGRELPPSHAPGRLYTLRAFSSFFDLGPHTIYTCFDTFNSIIRLPKWEDAHKKTLTFFHKSFIEFLVDSKRSGNFHINARDAEDDMTVGLFDVWNRCSGDGISPTLVKSTWHQHSLKHDLVQTSALRVFYSKLFHDLVHYLTRLVVNNLAGPGVTSLIHEQLRKILFNKLCYHLDSRDLWDLALTICSNYPIYSKELIDKKSARMVPLKNLKLSHLDWEGTSPAHVHLQGLKHNLYRPRASDELQSFLFELGSIQEASPELEVVIFGGVPAGRIAAFKSPLNNDHDCKYFIVPYPEQV